MISAIVLLDGVPNKNSSMLKGSFLLFAQNIYLPPGPFVMMFMIKIGIFITNPHKLMNNAIS